MDNNSLLPASFGEASQIELDDDDLVQASATCLASSLAGATNGAAIRYEGGILQSILWKYVAHSASRARRKALTNGSFNLSFERRLHAIYSC